MAQESLGKAKRSFLLKRFLGFLKDYRRSKRGMLGVGIISFFVVLSVFAPVIAPNDPIEAGNPPYAEKLCKPVWLSFFEGEETYTYDTHPIKDPEFSTFGSFQQIEQTSEGISLEYDEVGQLLWLHYRGNGTGSLEPYKASTIIRINTTWPYKLPPQRFLGNIRYYVINASRSTPVNVTVFLQRGDRRFDIWTPAAAGAIRANMTGWRTDDGMLDSLWSDVVAEYNNDPCGKIFPAPGVYQYGLEIAITDGSSDPVDIGVYVDRLDLIYYGNAFGLLGTDEQRVDLFSQLVYGTRISLIVGLLSAFLSVSIGLLFGLISGYLGSLVDEIVMRFTDMLLVLPGLPLLLVLIAVLGPSMWNLILLIGVLGWMGFARTVRSMVLSLKERPFIEAARAAGAGKFHIIFTHILPNVFSLVYVTLAMSVPGAITAEASLSWLGLFDPTVVSWGKILYNFQAAGVVTGSATAYWWWVVPPGIGIAMMALAFILMGYALDEILNPRLRQRR